MKFKSVLSLVIIIILSLTSCQSNNTSDNSIDVDNKIENTETDQSTMIDKSVTITIEYFITGSAADRMRESILLFAEEHELIDIEIVESNWRNHHEKLKISKENNEFPDIFLLDSVFVPSYINDGYLSDLTLLVESFNTEDYIGFNQLKTPNEKYYAVPQGIQVDVLFYNKRFFDEMGIDYPTSEWTLDDLKTNAIKLTTDKRFGFSIPPNNPRYGWYPIIRQFGGDILDETRRNSTIKSNPKVRDALGFIYDAWNVTKYVPNYSDMDGELTNIASTYFSREKVAMFYDAYVACQRNNDALIDYDVVVQPKLESQYASYIANCWVVPSNIEKGNMEAVQTFLKYYLSEENQLFLSESTSSLPPNKNVLLNVLTQSDKKPDNKDAFLKTFDFASPMAESVVWGEQNHIFQRYLDLYLRDEITIDEMINNSDKEIQHLLDEVFNK